MNELRHTTMKALYVLGLVGSALYFTLFGYVMNAQGHGDLALLAALGALTLALLLFQEALPEEQTDR